jgi:hypothetical protein
MLPLTINNFLLYCFLSWGSNIILNILGALKIYYPKLKSFDLPLDGRLEYKGDRLIGDSTTVIGLLLSIFFSLVIFIFSSVNIYGLIPVLVYFGHTIGSIIKRRMHKKSGEFVPFVDHGDYIILVGFVFWVSGFISYEFVLYSIFLTYILHPIACFIGYKLNLRERPL